MVLRIDPHTHCRDWGQSYKETIAHALDVARAQGLCAIFDMPNTNPPITTRELVDKRLALIPNQSPVWYGLYIGATANPEQLREAVSIIRENPRVIGMKLFAGCSTGDLAVIEEADQQLIFDTLAACDYRGVIFVHCEKEAFMNSDHWNPRYPFSHVWHRTCEAEVESVKDIISFAKKAGFKGKLYLGHISTPEAVDIIYDAKQELQVFSATTFHHLILHADLLKENNGILRKVNPSLKPFDTVLELRKRVKEGKVDCLETDHAPHALREKIGQPHASGFPGLPVYAKALEYLQSTLGIDQPLLNRMTSTNIIDIFGLDVAVLQEQVVTSEGRRHEYEYDAYQGIL